MKLIEPNPNPFFFINNILDACIERSAFHNEELDMISEARLLINYMGAMMEAQSEECDCGAGLPACDGHCTDESEEQLELPLEA